MKWYIFRKWYVAVLLMLGSPSVILGESQMSDCLSVSGAGEFYNPKLQRYKRGWERLIPQYQKVQFAGSMGVLSIGIGWDYGKKNQWETDLLIGYLPRFEGESGHLTMTLKENYIPWSIDLKNKHWKFHPFTVSFYVNKIFGEGFWIREPDKYPNGYYGVATNLRFNLAFGQRIQFKIHPIGLSDRITFYYECGTCDLYLISYFTNKYLHFSDIFHLSLGIKLQFL